MSAENIDGNIKIATLLAEIGLDYSGLEDGATAVERRYKAMMDKLENQSKQMQSTASAMDVLEQKIRSLQKEYENLEGEEKFNSDLPRQIQELIDKSDELNNVYAKQEDQLKKTASAASVLESQMRNQEAQKQIRKEYAETNLTLQATSSALVTIGNAIGIDGQLLAAAVRAISLYRASTNAAKREKLAEATATKAATVAKGTDTAANGANAASENVATVATKAHTAATVGLNAAITMGISLLALLVTKTIEYINSVKDAKTSVSELKEAYEQSIKSINDQKASSEAEIAVLDDLVEEYDKLNTKARLTEDEKSRLSSIVSTLRKTYSDLGWELDAVTGKWNVQTDAIKNNREALMGQIEAQYHYQKAAEAYKKMMEVLDEFGSEENLYQQLAYAERMATNHPSSTISMNFFDNSARNLREKVELYEELKSNYEKALERLKSGNSGSEAEYLERLKEGNVERVTEYADALYDALNEKYKQMRDAEKKVLQESMESWKRWQEENVSAIQAEIDALDALEKKEKSEKQAAELKHKAEEIAFKMRFETDAYNRQELQKAYRAAQSEYSDYVDEQAREAKKASLKAQMDSVKETAKQKQDELNQQIDDLEARYEKLTSKAALEAEAQKMIYRNSQSEILSTLKQYNADYFDLGKGFGERIAEGMEGSSVYRRVIDMVNKISNVAKTTLEQAEDAARKTLGSGQLRAEAYDNRAGIQQKQVVIENITISSGVDLTPSTVDAIANKVYDKLYHMVNR